MAPNRAAIPKPTEKLIYQQANSRCSFCGCDEIPLLDIHHIVPRSEGGSNEPSNLILSCKNCHARIHSESISENEVYRVKKSLGAVIYRMPGTPEPPPPSNVVSVGGDANGSIVAGQVTIHGDARLPSKMNHPAGSIGADLLRKNYVQYLVRRYDEFRQVGQRSYGQKGSHQYGAIHKNIQSRFKARTYFIPVERFDELVAYLHGRIDKTIQAKRNRAQGRRAYSSFEEYAREQQGR
jgi:hypothetical protein